MRVETGLPHLGSQVIEAARQAEAAGYDAVVSFETSHDPFLPLVLAAEHTQNVKLRTGLAISFPRSPMVVANVAWDLQGYSGGRFQLGLGTQVKGHNERRFSVPWSPPAPRMREYVLALRAIWNTWATGAPLKFMGEHYTFTLMTPNFSPERIAHPDIPIYVSALGPGMARVAGEVCDGLLIHPMCSYRYITEIILPAVEQGARKAGRRLEDIELLWSGFTATGDTEEELLVAKRSVARSISFYGSTRTYAAALELHGWKGLNLQLHELSLAGKWHEMTGLVTDEMVETLAETGTQEEVARKIRTRYGPICSAVMWSPRTGPGDPRTRAALEILHAGG
jgi:probable F420-dependent oxidoreductase